MKLCMHADEYEFPANGKVNARGFVANFQAFPDDTITKKANRTHHTRKCSADTHTNIISFGLKSELACKARKKRQVNYEPT